MNQIKQFKELLNMQNLLKNRISRTITNQVDRAARN